MRIIKPPIELLKERGGFASVPNEVVDHPYWVSARADSAFAALVKLYRVGGYKFPNLRQVAEQTGYNYNTWRHHLRTLVEAGFVRKVGLDLELYPFEDGIELPEADTPEFKPTAAPVAQERIVAEVKPKTAIRLPKGEREARIMEAWNSNLPEGWKEAKEVPLPVKCAIDHHMKECGITSGEYDKFIPAVLRMAEHVKKPPVGQIELGWVFGWDKSPAKPLEQWKVDQVRDLYNAGKKVKTYRRADSITWGDDQQVLSLFGGKPYRGVRFKRVDRIRIEEDQEVMLFAALNYLQFNDEYTVEQAKTKIAQAGVEWRDVWAEPGTLVLLYRKDASKIPFNWNLHETLNLFLNP